MTQAIRRHQARRRATQAGFTLIELLVVVIILGILAAVVVFAVSGTGDKGLASAREIEVRTIQTAQEAYCAQFGRYADADELVTGQFLADVPTYHQTAPAAAGALDALGGCPPDSDTTSTADRSRSKYLIACDATQQGCGAGGALKLSWTAQNSNNTTFLNGISFTDARNGWAVGNTGTIRHTTNGGTTWTTETLPVLSPPATATTISSVDCVVGNKCWATVSLQRIVTNNGGSTWTDQVIAPTGAPANLRFLDIDFVDPMNGWAVGFCGLIVRTTDGGATPWQVVRPYDCSQLTLLGVTFFDALRGWAGGNRNPAPPYGNVATTTDGGLTWTPQAGMPLDLNEFSFISPTQGWAVGVAGSANSNIWVTTDGGVSWSEQPRAATSRTAIEFLNTRYGFNVGVARVQRTADGGQTWNFELTPSPTAGINSLDMVDIGHGWVALATGGILRYGAVP